MMIKAQDIQTYLHSLAGDWVYPENAVDTFKAGNPDDPVQGIAVGWMSYTWALEKALELGCNVYITHEPTYYDHHDNNAAILQMPQVQAKHEFIEKNELIIIRCHDLWDQIQEVGIPDSWGKFLGLGEAVIQSMHHRVYDMSEQSAHQFARQVAGLTKNLQQPGVQLIGSSEKIIRRVCIGTGAITPYLTFVRDYQIDLAICTDDGIDYWRDGGFAIDMGIPIIVVNHMVSEEAGVESLARTLQKAFDKTPVYHIPQTCMYQLITAE